jgi:hypothetical protein
VKSPRDLVDESATPLDIVDAAGILGYRRFQLVNYLLVVTQDLEYALSEAHELDEEIPASVNVALLELRDWLARLGLDIDSDD